MARKKKTTIQVENLGPITEANVELGDLTVLVGPQASGKSVFLQTLKLAIDQNHIWGFFEKQKTVFNNGARSKLSGYYGRGMWGMLNQNPTVRWNGKKYDLDELTRFKRPKNHQVEKLFYIPAQRFVSLPMGISQSFNNFRFGDPYVLRYFGDQINIMLQSEFGDSVNIFPVKRRLQQVLRKSISEHIFGGAELRSEPVEFTNMLTLKVRGLPEGLPYLAWSAGQREFVPLLLGLYWLCPSGRVPRRDQVEWVVIEEPEMGLHPRAISAFLLLVLELMRRNYKVVISTHSTTVLDLVWTMQELKESKGEIRDVWQLFELKSSHATWDIADSALKKDYGVYFFERGKTVKNISTLDPGSEDKAVSNWGDLNGFAGRSAETVADVINRNSLRGEK